MPDDTGRYKRVIEVWQPGSDGAFVGRIEVLPTLDTAFLYALFSAEQQQPDPHMQASYWLDRDKCEALQPWVPVPLDPSMDYILSVTRLG